MADSHPNPRFNDYEEVQDNKGNPIGFKIKDSQFFFKYDFQGGWKDEKGNKYNSFGVLIEKEEDWGVNEDNVDEMEDLLMDEQDDSDDDQQPQVPLKTIDTQLLEAAQKLAGTSTKLKIFIKSRAQKQAGFKKIEVKGDNRAQINQSIENALKIVDLEERKQLQQQLPKNSVISFSVQDSSRYWFGYVPVTAQQVPKVLEQLKGNQSFGVLKSKTLFHLSNQIPNENTQKSRSELSNKIQAFSKDTQVVVTINGLAPKQPLSYILDLIEDSEVPLGQLYQIEFNTDTSVQILTTVKSAVLLTKFHQTKQGEGQLTVEANTSQNKLVEGKSFVVIMEKKKEFSPKDILQKQLLLPNSTDGYLKIDPATAEIIVGTASLRRLLMYRGSDVLIPIGLKLFVKS